MCRALSTGGRRCPSGCAGSGGCEYIDERMRQSVDSEAETQKFSKVHQEVLEEVKGKTPKEELERAVGPQEFENFHKVVSKMIAKSDMTEHDKMIARRKWNRAEQEVSQGQVTEVTLKTWEKMAAGSVLFMIDRIDSKGRKVQWRQLNRALKASVSVREYAHSGEDVVPEGYASYEDFIHDLESDEASGEVMDWDDVETLESHRTNKVDPREVNNDSTVFDGDNLQQQESLSQPNQENATEQTENNKKEPWEGPKSFARRPKSERGAHKAGKPVKEPQESDAVKDATIFDEVPVVKEDTGTQQMPKVTVTPVPQSKLAERLNGLQ
jgi:hypothetical protein